MPIKLPWRRFGGERPDPKQEVLVWGTGEFASYAANFLPSETRVSSIACWEPRYSNTSWDTYPDDRWIYLSEIANPFEEEGK